MAVVAQVSIEGDKELQRLFSRLDPSRKGVRWQRESLKKIAFEVQKTATQKKIKRRGKKTPPLPTVLSNRHGGAGLVGSIAVNERPLPGAIEVGSALKYAAVHELGGVFGIPSHFVEPHSRNVVFGKRVAAFTVPRHFRMGHDARFPKRPFLVPALNDVTPKMASIFVREIEKELGTRG